MALEDRRKREKEQRRNAILSAARKMFFKKGFKDVTVENIAKQAELSKGSIYLYFNSKEEIYTHILLSDIEKFNKKSAHLFLSGKKADALIHELAGIYIDFFLNDRELFRIMMNFMLHIQDMDLEESVNQHLIEATNNTVKIIETIINAGIEKGEFSADINLRQTRNAIWGFLNGIISLYLFTGRETNREERIHTTVQESLTVFIHGLKTCPKVGLTNGMNEQDKIS